MGYNKKIYMEKTEQCGDDWINHQDDEKFIEQMRDLGWTRSDALDHLEALKSEISS